MKLNYKGLKDRAAWENADIALPEFDIEKMLAATAEAPQWVHFGAGNIFRAYIAALSQSLLNMGLTKSGIVAVETFDFEIINKAFKPFDNLALLIGLGADGSMEKRVIASIAKSICADDSQWEMLCDIFRNPSLQMVSFTITEKGYALYDSEQNLLPVVAADIEHGTGAPNHIMSIVASLMYSRFQAGGAPIALVSMDNCSKNGDVLQGAIITVAKGLHAKGFVESAFIDYLSDESKVSYPWSMIDKITPYPDDAVYEELTRLGISDMTPHVTEKETATAPFVNAEMPEYLVLEDSFPNGRPPLEKVGVYMTDREIVGKAEKMKVTTCLNPLHTALSVFGCLLGFKKVSDMMNDSEMVALANRLGYVEGMPVVVDPKIINPPDFLKEVIEKRLPNPFLPDTPQRIVTETSQKVAIRFGETIKAYMAHPELDTANLVAIPLAIAGWLRYLLAVDDEGNEMPLAPDPMLPELCEALKDIRLGQPDTLKEQLSPILSNKSICGVDLYEAGLGEKIEDYFRMQITKPGAVRETLRKYLHQAI
ncbi:MAG: mannitol dehydrogenase family protein [Oscillospiraceae bacterium]|nr:mannitol dehydrogenase family protein [Oscillospiraceae bacterium]MCL2279925.1 mannitol dehydrogenase family protein [Oscillospiraceae bacterium]